MNTYFSARSGASGLFLVALFAAISTFRIFAHEGHDHSKPDDKDKLSAGSNRQITGEIVDLMCYVDHGAMGEKHAECAATCVKSGGPVGIVSDGKAYLVVGEHKPINDQLGDFCGKTVTLKGKLAERGGMAMLENAEMVKK